MITTGTNKVSKSDAESLAIEVLTFLADDEERLYRFFGLTGLTPDTLRQNASSSNFLAAVLDHLLSDESLLLVFCAHAGVSPQAIAPAKRTLETPE